MRKVKTILFLFAFITFYHHVKTTSRQCSISKPNDLTKVNKERTKSIKDKAEKRKSLKEFAKVGNYRLQSNDYSLKDMQTQIDKQTISIDKRDAMEFTLDKVNDVLRDKGVLTKNELNFPIGFKIEIKTNPNDPMRTESTDYSKPIICGGKEIGTTNVNINIDRVNPNGFTGNGPDTSHIGFTITRTFKNGIANTNGVNIEKGKMTTKVSGHIFVDDSIL
jgi:hypothetical protein